MICYISFETGLGMLTKIFQTMHDPLDMTRDKINTFYQMC